jgi:NADH-quinone oxidoreductase subunit M
MPILSILIFLPLIASLLIVCLPEQYTRYFKWITVIICIVELFLTLLLYKNFDTHSASYQFLEQIDWITLPMGKLGTVSIDYILAIDGASLPLVLLTGIVMLIGAISSFEIQERQRAYFGLYLLLTSAIMGCFVALDFFLFYLFFEFMLLPMYFLIGLWGGPRREYASIKFFIYTLVGSLLILVVMIALYIAAIDPVETAINIGLITNKLQATPAIIGQIQEMLLYGKIEAVNQVHTFNFFYLSDTANFVPESWLSTVSGANWHGTPIRMIAFLLVFLGFAVKLPMVPLHTWLPDAHVEAPTPVSVVLAGVLLKIGGYGFYRIAYSIFPDAANHYAFLVGILGVISIIYGAYNALSMSDLKRMIAYSSVSHMGFVLLGMASLTSEGINGAIYQMFSHGILSAMLFLLVGVLYSRTHDRQIENYRGLAQKMPQFTVLTAIAFFASLGLPAFSGFIGEFFSLMGGFNSELLPNWLSGVATLGLVLGAAYFLWTFQKMFLGKFWVSKNPESISDLSDREKLMLVSLAILALLFGIFPHLLFDITNQTVGAFLVP